MSTITPFKLVIISDTGDTCYKTNCSTISEAKDKTKEPAYIGCLYKVFTADGSCVNVGKIF